MPIAVNDQTGEALRLDEHGAWVPTEIADNPDTGESVVLDGDKWVPLPKASAAPEPATPAPTTPAPRTPPPIVNQMLDTLTPQQNPGHPATTPSAMDMFNRPMPAGAAGPPSMPTELMGSQMGDRPIADQRGGTDFGYTSRMGNNPLATMGESIPATAPYMPKPAAQDPNYNFVSGMGEAIPYADEIEGSLQAAIRKFDKGDPTTYDKMQLEEIEKYRTQRDQFNREHPGQAIAAPVMGGMLLAGGLLRGGGKAAAGGPRALAASTTPLAVGKSVLGTAARAAPVGFLEGSGQGEGGIAERLEPGVWGAALNMGLAPLSHAAGNVASAVGSWMKGTRKGADPKMLREMGNVLQEGGLSQPATRDISRRLDDIPSVKATLSRVQQALDDAQITPEQAADRLRSLQATAPDAMLADINTSLARLTRAVHTGGGEGAQDVTEKLALRAADQRERTRDLVRANVSHDDPNLVKEDIVAARRKIDQPNFDALEKIPYMTPRLATAMEDSTVTDALETALRTEARRDRAAGMSFDPTIYGVTVGPNGENIFTQPTLKLWHRAKTAIDDQLEEYKNIHTGEIMTSKLAKGSGKGQSIVDLQSTINKELTDHPLYQEAVDKSKDSAISIKALDDGRNFMDHDWDKMLDRFNTLDDEDKAYFRMGVSRKLMDIIDKANERGTDVTGALVSERMWKRLRGILPPEQADTLERSIWNERDLAHTGHMVTGGSQTAPRAADVAAGVEGLNPFDLLTSGGRANFGRQAWALASRNIDRSASGKTGNLLAPIMTTSDEQAMQNLVRRLNTNRQQNMFVPPEAAVPVGGLLGFGAGIMDTRTANQERR